MSPLLFLVFINGVSTIFKDCKYLLFANDLEIFLNINNINDCYKLQNDLDRFIKWCVLNNLSVNVTKRTYVSFVRKRNPIMDQYNIDGTTSTMVSKINDIDIKR